MFTDADKLEFKRFCQSIIESPRPMDDCNMKRSGAFIWCDEWEIIEILKYLFNGPDMYAQDPPPNRLKNNPLWSKEEIVAKAEGLIKVYSTAENIIGALKARRA